MKITDEMVQTFYDVMTSTPDNVASPVREDIRAGLAAVFSEYIEAELSSGQIAYEPHVLDTWYRALDLAQGELGRGVTPSVIATEARDVWFPILLAPPEVPQ